MSVTSKHITGVQVQNLTGRHRTFTDSNVQVKVGDEQTVRHQNEVSRHVRNQYR
jgi:hypothetical protein